MSMSRPLRVLLVEDNPLDAGLVEQALRRSGLLAVCTRVETEAQFLHELSPDFDIVLSDFGLPQFDGLRALELLKSRGYEIPFILVSGSIGEETAVSVIKHGAADYLLKDRLVRLGQAVRQALTQGQMQRERQRAEARLREQAEILDRARNAILVVDLATRQITYWNQGAERLYGWTAHEVVGRRSADLFTGEAAEAIFQEVLAKGEWRGDVEHATRDGARLVVDSHASRLAGEGRRQEAALFLNVDVTLQRSLETQLLRAQRMESLGTLAGGIAHDLNNVLSPILMGVQLLQGTLDAEKDRPLLEMMETSCLRGAALVKQVLAFARGVEGQRRVIQPSEILAELQEIIRDTFPKRLQLEIGHPPDLWSIVGDATQIHQVAMNLCVNARDAMPAGGTLRVSASNAIVDDTYASMIPGSKPGPFVLLEVTDTGTGIPQSLREKIFDPFFTTKEASHGTGLGLSTSLSIVRSHGGFISVYSEVGKGTTFKVYLPAMTTPQQEAAAGPEDTDLPRGHGELVLVAEDEEPIRILTQKTLERFGYRVILAMHGAEAVALYAQYRGEIAAVLTDMDMSILDGPATIVALKAIDPAVRILCSSGLGSAEQMTKAIDAGVSHFVPKPYSAESLLKALARVLAPGH